MQPIRYALPLAEFAAAYEGPPAYPKAIEHPEREARQSDHPVRPIEDAHATLDCQPK